MRTSRLFVWVPALVLAALVTASCSHMSYESQPAGANAAGTWTWTYDAAGQNITHTYVIKQTGETLTGTFNDTADETTAEIKDGKIHNGQVSFTVARPFTGNAINFTFTGKLEGNTIKGQASWTIGDQPTTADWLAKRNP